MNRTKFKKKKIFKKDFSKNFGQNKAILGTYDPWYSEILKKTFEKIFVCVHYVSTIKIRLSMFLKAIG